MVMLQASVKMIACESIYIYLEPICPLFLVQKKVFSNQNKGHQRVPGMLIPCILSM